MLNPTSHIAIVERGPFETAAGVLADVLTKYLLACLGKSELTGNGSRVTFILETQARHWRDLPPEMYSTASDIDTFEIKVISEPEPKVFITGRTPRSTGFGVMTFLENYLGVFWAFPGDLGVCLPDRQTFTLKDGVLLRSPWVVARSLSGLKLTDPVLNQIFGKSKHGVLNDHRDFFLGYDYFKSLRLHPNTVTHHMSKIFPVETCKAEYPEVFPILADGSQFIPSEKQQVSRGGKNAYQAWHPCYTEAKTLEVAVTQGRKELAEGRLFYSLGISDGQCVQCRCNDCISLRWPQSYYQFVNHVAHALQNRYPPQMVGVLAYGDVGIPPKDLRLCDNVLVNMAGNRKTVWDNVAPAWGTYEYIYGAGFVIPNLPLDVIQTNMQYYQQRTLQLYYAEAYPVWAFDAPKVFIISRLLWDPNQDVYDLLRVYCDRSFGPAGGYMCRFYEQIAAIRKTDAQRGSFVPVWGKIWPFRDPLQFLRCPADLHERLLVCIQQARARQLDTLQKRRLDMIEVFTRFSQAYYEIHTLKEAIFEGQIEPEPALARAQTLQVRTQGIMAAFSAHPQWFVGTAVDVDGFSDRAWPIAELNDQLASAIATARQQLSEPNKTFSTPVRLKAIRKEEHPWYKPDRHVRMIVTEETNAGFSFVTHPNTEIRDDEDPRYNGRLKAQWLHGSCNSLNMIASRPYHCMIELEGFGGLLECTIQGKVQTPERPKLTFSHSFDAFVDETDKLTKTIVIDPVQILERVQMTSDEMADLIPLNFQVYLLWRPDDTTARLSGDIRLSQLLSQDQP